MWKLVKHQLKGRRTLYITGLIIMLGITFYLAAQIKTAPTALATDRAANGAIIGWLVVCWCTFYLVMTIVNVVNYTNELYGDTSYLIFSLPLRGWQILGSRVVLVAFDTLMTLVGGMTTVIALSLMAPDIAADVRPNLGWFLITGDYWLLCLLTLVAIVCSILVFFFGITLGKTFSNAHKGIGTFTAPIVIVLILWLVGRAAGLLIDVGPTLVLDPWRNLHGAAPVTMSVGGFNFPVLSYGLLLVVGVAAFVLTGWLMDRHLNL